MRNIHFNIYRLLKIITTPFELLGVRHYTFLLSDLGSASKYHVRRPRPFRPFRPSDQSRFYAVPVVTR